MARAKISGLDKEMEISSAVTLFNNLAMNGVMVYNECGGKGRCGKCKVRLLTEQDKRIKKVNDIEKKHLTQEQIEQGWRLSCQVYAIKDIEIEIPSFIDKSK